MKRFTLSIIAGALALSAWAHRDVYFNWGFSMNENLGHNSWSYEGADYQDGTAEPLLICNGFYTHNGVPSLVIKHDQRSIGERLMPNLKEVRLKFICGTENGGAAHVTPMVEIEDEYGEKVFFDFDPIKDTLEESQEVISKGMRGDISALGQINFVNIYFDGVDADRFEILSPTTISMCSDWISPVVSSKNVAVTMDYIKNPAGVRSEETGVTYIQAEDFDESWINGHVGHSTMKNNNSGYRLFENDKTAMIQKTDDGGGAGRWTEGFGRVIASHVTTAASGGLVIQDFCPSGADWEKYYGSYENADGGISLENAFKNWGAWTEYTFEASEDMELGISLRVAAHRLCYEPQVSSGSPYWYEPASSNGYYLTDYPDDEFFSIFGHKYMVALDGEWLRTAYDKAPAYKGDGNAFMSQIVPDPTKWTDNRETVDGKKENSIYLTRTPYPFWNYESGDPNVFGNGWQPFYIKDMLEESVNRGLVSAEAVAPYAHADYIVTIPKGRHTIKVQNCGGINAFDEIKLEAKTTGGVEGVTVDGYDGEFHGTPEIFDLQGRRISNPSNGIYIVKRGNKITKEVIR